jgi:ubiquinone biosynthesis protein
MRRMLRAASIVHAWGRYFWRTRGDNNDAEAAADELCETLRACGILFVKIGQVMALHVGADEALASRLAGLHADADTLGVDRADLAGLLPEGVTVPGDAEPVASGSAAHVYRGDYKGRPVAVKVRRRSAVLDFKASLLLLGAARAAARVAPMWRMMDVAGLLSLVERVIRQQVDFRNEVANWRRFRDLYSQDVVVPHVYEDVCTDDVIVMDFIEGSGIHEEDLDEAGRRRVAEAVSRFYMRSIAIEGVFHADCHPGNVMLSRDARLAFCDFGMVEELDAAEREHVTRVYMHLCNGDARGMASAILGGFVRGYDPFLHDDVRKELEAGLRGRLQAPNSDTVDVIGDLSRVVLRNLNGRMRLNHKLTVMNLTVVNADRIINRVCPGFDTFAVIKGTVRDALLAGKLPI